MTDLHDAAANGDADAVRALLDAGANANATDARRRTPLHRAALIGDADSPRIAGRRRQAKPQRQVQADAAFEGNSEVVSALLSAGANPNAQDSDNMTPLDVARLTDNTAAAMLLSRARA